MNYISSLYYYLTYAIYILYVVIFFGLWNSAPEYMEIFNYFIRTLIALVLLYSFNPFSKTKLTKFHKDVAFSAGILILLSLSLNSLHNYIVGLTKLVYIH